MNPKAKNLTLDQPAKYRIHVQGRVSEDWSAQLGDMKITVQQSDDGRTISVLTGAVIDQAGLHGLLRTIRDLGLPLLLVEWIE